MKTVKLYPFERTQKQTKFQLSTNVETNGSTLTLEYICSGDLLELLIPHEKESTSRLDNLWEHTCFEAFMTQNKGPEYWELNFSPSGDWNFYRFDDHRKGQSLEEKITNISSQIKTKTDQLFEAKVVLDLSAVFPGKSLSGIQLGLTAVIEELDHSKSYWALSHCGKQPDFHIRDSFTFSL